MKKFTLPLLLALSGTSYSAPLQTVDFVDVSRYMGKWYEIARFDNSFQKNCEESTAEYSLKKNGKVSIVNTCKKKNSDDFQRIEGEAKIVDQNSNAKLKVSFVPAFLRPFIPGGDYWIIGLEENYHYAVVSEPKRKFLWILSRTPELTSTELEEAFEIIRSQKLDPKKLIFPRK